MKKLMNDPRDFVDEMLEGLVSANPTLEIRGETRRVIARSTPNKQGKVGVVSGGGSGHLPLFTGYVGEGLLDSCSIGNVFEGPNVDSCIEAIRAADGGAGVLRLYGNYGGDRMNFDMAGEMLELENIKTTTVLGTDDVASAQAHERHKRRGVAGILFAYKAAGARAAEGGNLEEVTQAAQHAVDMTRTIGVALNPCQVPGASNPTFAIEDDEMELGMGIHGEPGLWRDKLKPADAVVDEMIDRLLENRPEGSGNRVAVLVNSLGATPLEELFIMYRRVRQRLTQLGVEIAFPLVGHYVTSMEMQGASISLSFVDDELERLLREPASCPFWKVEK
jgi:phosphoenolpyruvate---glycerone phosphotransferase subunit DhaK